MLFDIMDVLVGGGERLLVFLSKWQVKAARRELKHLKALRMRIKNHQQEVEKDLNEIENDIEVLEYFLKTEYKEL